MGRWTAIACVLVGCGGSSAATPAAETPESAPTAAPSAFACVVESWSMEELGRATGRGANASEAIAEATRALCADRGEECPSDVLRVWPTNPGPDQPAFSEGVEYRLMRRHYATHQGRSERSREEACLDAERAIGPSEMSQPHGVAGVNGLRWHDAIGGSTFFPPTSAQLIEALPALHYEPPAEAESTFECSIAAEVTPILWQHQLSGNQGDACIDQRPPTFGGGITESIAHCDAEESCETVCFVLGQPTEVRAKGQSETSQREACVDATSRLCAGDDCAMVVLSVDGISGSALGSHARRRARPPP